MPTTHKLPSSWLVLGLQLLRNVVCFIVFVLTIICANKICTVMNMPANQLMLIAFAALAAAGVAFAFIKYVSKLDEQYDHPPGMRFHRLLKNCPRTFEQALNSKAKPHEVWRLIGTSADEKELTYARSVKYTTYGFFFYFSTTTTVQASMVMKIVLTPSSRSTDAIVSFLHEGNRNQYRSAKEKALNQLFAASQQFGDVGAEREPVWTA